jgi:N utilization substance protein A
VTFATHALNPAKITRVAIVDAMQKHMEVIVDDSQLSLAIGKKGQNVRLAAKLLGWRIDIKSEEEKRQEVESAMAALVAPGAPVSVLIDYGLPESTIERLVEAGVGTVERLGSMTPEDLEGIQGIGIETVEKIQEAVNSYYGQFEPASEYAQAETAEYTDDGVTNAAVEEEAAQPEESLVSASSEEASEDTESDTMEASDEESGEEPVDGMERSHG